MDQALNAVSNYCELWKLKINVNKTKIIRFAKKKNGNPNNQYDFWLNGEKLEIVDDYVYLGTTVSFNGKYKKSHRKTGHSGQKGSLWFKIKERNV